MRLVKSLLGKILISSTFLLIGASVFSTETDKALVKDGDHIAIIGDSITEQKTYSRYIEEYLLACSGIPNLKVFQFGWSGETAPGFVARMENDAFFWNPNVVTTCYGMNDGRYTHYDYEKIGKPYEAAMEKIIQTFKKRGATVIVGSPGVVDTNTYTRAIGPAYNKNLAELAALDKKLAEANGMPFADIYSAMTSAMEKSKAAYGPSYHFAGGDGVHPAANGHLVMAYAILKAMKLDGKIGNIEMDWNGKAKTDAGHKILTESQGKIEIESSKYPFCFNGGEKDPNGNVSILPFVPFNDELNRFELKVKNLPSTKAEISWGDQKKTFTKAELEKGINLAAEFIKNPFSESFDKMNHIIWKKQNFETGMIKGVITNFRNISPMFEGDKDQAKIKESQELIRKKYEAKQAELDKELKDAFVPVKHTITVTPVN